MADTDTKKEELVRFRNKTNKTQIIHYEGKKITLIAEPIKGTVLLPPSKARKFGQALERVE